MSEFIDLVSSNLSILLGFIKAFFTASVNMIIDNPILAVLCLLLVLKVIGIIKDVIL